MERPLAAAYTVLENSEPVSAFEANIREWCHIAQHAHWEFDAKLLEMATRNEVRHHLIAATLTLEAKEASRLSVHALMSACFMKACHMANGLEACIAAAEQHHTRFRRVMRAALEGYDPARDDLADFPAAPGRYADTVADNWLRWHKECGGAWARLQSSVDEGDADRASANAAKLAHLHPPAILLAAQAAGSAGFVKRCEKNLLPYIVNDALAEHEGQDALAKADAMRKVYDHFTALVTTAVRHRHGGAPCN